MKTGDAECTLWLEGRSYCLTAISVRRGPKRMPQDLKRVSYQWSVEEYDVEGEEVRAARRLADAWETASGARARRAK